MANANRDDPATAKNMGTQPRRGDVKEQRGGKQEDQIVGQTEKGAMNQETRGRNPQGNPPEIEER
jgi:hypothetical protein